MLQSRPTIKKTGGQGGVRFLSRPAGHSLFLSAGEGTAHIARAHEAAHIARAADAAHIAQLMGHAGGPGRRRWGQTMHG